MKRIIAMVMAAFVCYGIGSVPCKTESRNNGMHRKISKINTKSIMYNVKPKNQH